jgi:predicted phage terminase large subunit-like protein
LPALAEADDVLNRAEGEALWPERFPVEQLLEKKRSVGSYWWSSMYQQRPVPIEGGFFKHDWLQFYDPARVPYMDTIIQSWDTAQTKSSTSDYVVGQVWGRIGGDFYLLDQKRGRWDFDETVEQMKIMAQEWPDSSAKLIEAQTVGAALASHLKHQIPGLIPINVRAPKELRALNCLPVWQSKNVYLPKPDDGEYAWVDDYVRELLTFPNAANDDQTDATTLALNQLRGTLFPDVKASMADDINSQPLPDRTYFIGWAPARQEDRYTALVFDLSNNTVVSFGKFAAEPIENQLTSMYQLSRMYNGAVVRAFDGIDEALLFGLEVKGVYVQRCRFTKTQLGAVYENLAMLMNNKHITFPHEPDLLAELEVFKSEFTLDESPDYSLQIGAQSAIHAACLVTFDLSPEVVEQQFQPSIYFSYDRSLFP